MREGKKKHNKQTRPIWSDLGILSLQCQLVNPHWELELDPHTGRSTLVRLPKLQHLSFWELADLFFELLSPCKCLPQIATVSMCWTVSYTPQYIVRQPAALFLQCLLRSRKADPRPGLPVFSYIPTSRKVSTGETRALYSTGAGTMGKPPELGSTSLMAHHSHR